MMTEMHCSRVSRMCWFGSESLSGEKTMNLLFPEMLKRKTHLKLVLRFEMASLATASSSSYMARRAAVLVASGS